MNTLKLLSRTEQRIFPETLHLSGLYKKEPFLATVKVSHTFKSPPAPDTNTCTCTSVRW